MFIKYLFEMHMRNGYSIFKILIMPLILIFYS